MGTIRGGAEKVADGEGAGTTIGAGDVDDEDSTTESTIEVDTTGATGDGVTTPGAGGAEGTTSIGATGATVPANPSEVVRVATPALPELVMAMVYSLICGGPVHLLPRVQ